MQTVKWISFCLANSLTRTVVHFFPSAGGVTAPYPATCKISLFGQNYDSKSVTLEGAKLSQPDGVRLDQIFEPLKEGVVGFFGLEVAITSSQQRVDLSASDCVIELSARGHSTRFRPIRWTEREDSFSENREGLILKDSFNTTSLILVNPTDTPLAPQTFVRDPEKQENFNLLSNSPVGPMSVVEVDLDETYLSKLSPQTASWGLCRISNMVVMERGKNSLASFILYRDALTKRPVSVSVL